MVLPFGQKGFKPEGKLIKSLILWNLLPPTLASFPDSSHWIENTVRVVKVVDPCNPFGTEPSPTIGVERVSTNLNHLPIFEIS